MPCPKLTPNHELNVNMISQGQPRQVTDHNKNEFSIISGPSATLQQFRG